MVSKQEIKKEAKRLLQEGKVKCVVGYRRGTSGPAAAPLFARTPEEADQLTWNAACFQNLVRYLEDLPERPVAVVVKGCDSRAVNVLIQEKKLKREDVYLIGVSCEHTGMVDFKKLARRVKAGRAERIKFEGDNRLLVMTSHGNIHVPAHEVMQEKCIECPANYPVVYDVMVGETVERKPAALFKSIEHIETLSPDRRWQFWEEQVNKCIRCYACRSICPMCYCEECVMDPIRFAVTPDTPAEEKARKIKWIEKSPTSSENLYFHLLRALHLAGRCVDCGECERACPMDIPIRLLNKKMEKEAAQQFDYRVGFDPEQPSLVSDFKDDDPQDFIR